MTWPKFDQNLLIVVIANVIIHATTVTAVCFLFYTNHPIAGGFALASMLVSSIDYHGGYKQGA